MTQSRRKPMLTLIQPGLAHTPQLKVDPAAILAVVPALNEARHIEACIRSLMTGSPVLRLVPLTVADCGSSDGTQAIVERLKGEFPNLRLLGNPGRLQSAALNLAAQAHSSGRTRYLVRCDAHALYPQNFILLVAAALQRTGAASVAVPIDAVGETCFEKGNAWVVDTLLGSGGSAHRGGRRSAYIDHGHHAGFDIDWFRKLGGYDETFSHNEDAEYDVRLGKAGGKVWLAAGIRIRYVPRGTVRSLARQYYSHGRGRARSLAKHGSRLKLREAVPLIALLGSWLGLLAAPFCLPALVLPAGYLSLLAGASAAVAVKRKSFCGLFAGIAAGTMHLCWAAGYLMQQFEARDRTS